MRSCFAEMKGMVLTMQIVITEWSYLFASDFNEQTFVHPDSRLMDRQTKIAVTLARQICKKANAARLAGQELGVVYHSDTGPLQSVAEYTLSLRRDGFTGVNPSKFPNIMAATPLSRVTAEIGAKGPCISLLSPGGDKHRWLYAVRQIAEERCRAMILLHITKKLSCFGCFLEASETCKERYGQKYEAYIDLTQRCRNGNK